MESSSSSSFSGSSKRAKAPGSSNEIPHCLVDGCVADLSLCRDYHRRHKVCEVHSKSPRVTIEGREQRFCQQCSRFHSLTEFDEGKRSCRKRLEGHNRRRRKPQPESLIQNPGFLFTNQSSFSGPSILSFGDQQILPSSVVPPNAWPGLLKVEHEMVSPYGSNMVEYNQRPDTFPKFPSYNFRGLHDDHHQLHFHESSSSSTLRNHPNFFSEGLNHQGVDRDRALSLLSPAPEATHEFSLNHTGTEPIHTATQPSMVRDYNYHNFSLLHHQFPEESKDGNGVSSSSSSQYHDGSGSTAQVPEMFQHGEGSSVSGSHQTLSFMWE